MITQVSLLASQLTMSREGIWKLYFISMFSRSRSMTQGLCLTQPTTAWTWVVSRNVIGKISMWCEGSHTPNQTGTKRQRCGSVSVCRHNHDGDKLTTCSRSGLMIYMNTTLINAISKKKATIEPSVFRTELVALNYGMECFHGLIYKLCMMCVHISGSYYIYRENMAAIQNTQPT